MSTFIQSLSPEQQDDMRGLLEPILAYFKETQPDFKDAEVWVTPESASIVVRTGVIPDAEEGQEASNVWTKMRSRIRAAFWDFYVENYTSTGSPLMQNTEEGMNRMAAHYRLAPNDILSAEKWTASLLKRLRLNYEQNQPAKA